jgi:aerobic carbon-monoxide dehydrogenase large subunit
MPNVTMTVNGKPASAEVEGRTLLVHFLREKLKLTGTHVGCDTTQCGCCTVHLDGKPVKSCTVLASACEGAKVTTIEGIGSTDALHPMQEAFHVHHGLQCGYCTPGMIMAGLGIVARNGNDLDEHTIRDQLEGNICRCTGYHNIVKAIQAGAKAMRDGGPVRAEPVEARTTDPFTLRQAQGERVENGIGAAVPRKEDIRLITGTGTYSDDYNEAGQAYAYMVRSPHAHARIKSIDTSAALKIPGVIAVLTGKDMLADGLKPIPHNPFAFHPAELPLENKDGSEVFVAPQYPLAHEKARYVGEGVAIVIAETVAAAKDGAEHVEVDYEVLTPVTGTVAAAQAGAPRVWDEHSNVCLDAEVGDREATDAAFEKAAHVVRFETWVQRVTGVPMEPRAALGVHDPASGNYTLYAGSGGAVRLKNDLATMLNVPETTCRAVMHDVGGNFGTRGMIYPEHALVPWASKRVGRPVKYTCERQEAFVSDYQGRDLAVEAELALDKDGTFLAMRGSNISNIGAHVGRFTSLQKGIEIMTSIYRVPLACFRGRAVLSNTAPTRPYRSSGRPEVMFVMERLIDLACREHGFDRAQIRLKNLLTSAELPHKNPFGMVYDSGDYPGVMQRALDLGDWNGFPARKAEAKRRGKCRGIGVANYVDTATGAPRERAEITVHPEGRVDVVIGTVSQGQGHETSFAQLVTEFLGVPLDKARIIAGDTAVVKVGGGAHSGRGMRLGSIVIWNAANKIIEKGKRIAARLLECDPSDVTFQPRLSATVHPEPFDKLRTGFAMSDTVEGRTPQSGRFVAGDRSLGLFEVAAAAQNLADLPDDLRGPLADFSDETIGVASFPYGAHVCEVEIDPETGTVEIVNYSAVDDVGRAVNPLIIHGQVHGGIAQGAGQALLEHAYYHPETGQLLAGSFMDYAMPRAENFPFFQTESSEIPCTTHPLGIRPAGEGGTTPALGVVINAVVDALSEFGVKHIEMPATPSRVWRAIQDAKGARA